MSKIVFYIKLFLFFPVCSVLWMSSTMLSVRCCILLYMQFHRLKKTDTCVCGEKPMTRCVCVCVRVENDLHHRVCSSLKLLAHRPQSGQSLRVFSANIIISDVPSPGLGLKAGLHWVTVQLAVALMSLYREGRKKHEKPESSVPSSRVTRVPGHVCTGSRVCQVTYVPGHVPCGACPAQCVQNLMGLF